MTHPKHLAAGALLAALPFAASGQNFSDDFTGTDGSSLGSEWDQGNAGDVEIQSNSADPTDADPIVFGVDPNVSKIENASDFTITTEFTADSGGAGVWFLGRSDANSNNQAAISGFGVRFFPNTGFLQALDFDGGTSFSANRWDSTPDANQSDFSQTDTFRMTVSSGGGASPDSVDILLESITGTNTNLVSANVQRPNGLTELTRSGQVFGIWNDSSTNNASFNNFSAVPEPSTYTLFFGGAVGLVAFFRRSRRKS